MNNTPYQTGNDGVKTMQVAVIKSTIKKKHWQQFGNKKSSQTVSAQIPVLLLRVFHLALSSDTIRRDRSLIAKKYIMQKEKKICELCSVTTTTATHTKAAATHAPIWT